MSDTTEEDKVFEASMSSLMHKIQTIGVEETVRRLEAAADLVRHCLKFIKENDISCAETIYQTDRVIENAPEFIEGMCNILGYTKIEDEEDEGG